MRAAVALCALSWGGLMGFVVAAMTGVWWQLPYFAVAAVTGGIGTFVALARLGMRR